MNELIAAYTFTVGAQTKICFLIKSYTKLESTIKATISNLERKTQIQLIYVNSFEK